MKCSFLTIPSLSEEDKHFKCVFTVIFCGYIAQHCLSVEMKPFRFSMSVFMQTFER